MDKGAWEKRQARRDVLNEHDAEVDAYYSRQSMLAAKVRRSYEHEGAPSGRPLQAGQDRGARTPF
eukprot:5111450-Prorocentrum_lima.AAC.1